MPGEFQVTRQSVTKCANCPAFDDTYAVCNLLHRGLIEGEGDPEADPPPDWCPLRKNPVQLVLLGAGWGERQG